MKKTNNDFNIDFDAETLLNEIEKPEKPVKNVNSNETKVKKTGKAPTQTKLERLTYTLIFDDAELFIKAQMLAKLRKQTMKDLFLDVIEHEVKQAEKNPEIKKFMEEYIKIYKQIKGA